MKKFIPNLLSLTNAFTGALGVYLTLTHSIYAGVICMAIAIVCDFFDGFAARALHAFSPLGVDLDSLADAISFGVLPATMVTIALRSFGFFLPEFAFIIVPFSVYRLAKFNHDERQSTSFIGLPTPANALFWAGLSAWMIEHIEMVTHLPRMTEYKVYVGLPFLLILMSILLVSEIPMFSLKMKNYGWKGNEWTYTVVLVTIAALLWLGIPGLAIGLGLYVLVNLFKHFWPNRIK